MLDHSPNTSRNEVMSHGRFSLTRFRWLRACAEGTFALLVACAGTANAQPTLEPTPAVVTKRTVEVIADAPKGALPPAPLPVADAPARADKLPVAQTPPAPTEKLPAAPTPAVPPPAPCDSGCPGGVDWTKIPP